ncbi:MAG: GGDEF domain-containing protein [Gammaproteobacteria bacterium]|nr:GGDEF domain-containing protein [Gammaproteobacteria bacterium]
MSMGNRILSLNHPLLSWLQHSMFLDLVSCKEHSTDFCGTRAEYIFVRIRLISFIFAVIALLWIPIDYLMLSPEYFIPLLIMRLLFGLLFLLQVVWLPVRLRMRQVYLRLVLFFLVPGIFYVASQLLLADSHSSGFIVGYNFLPYLMVGLLAIFPLTLLEALFFALLCGLPQVLFHLFIGNLFTLEIFGELWLLGLLVGIAIWVELSQLHMLMRLYREATLDPLTALVNRRVLVRWMNREINDAARSHQPLAVLLFDLDKFKRINDEFGHLMGDQVLRLFARILRQELGDKLFYGRYGGEEFLAILPGYDLVQATAVAERIRDRCHQERVAVAGGEDISLTTSIGVARWQVGERFDDLISRVDQGLYMAKEWGRDRVVSAPGS